MARSLGQRSAAVQWGETDYQTMVGGAAVHLQKVTCGAFFNPARGLALPLVERGEFPALAAGRRSPRGVSLKSLFRGDIMRGGASLFKGRGVASCFTVSP
ncbi:hypothetical protein EYF80_063203 [Liparis tanakae]|uniref:Uncharacterized protein n=1 Tax=Liparis tanakae TaxID=230148 RepID=A0A4Z2ED43_9TELE|nr:hypothetical protein EYF80_063203 [Liparis tanakae]